jgi:nicotinamidase-related amidase
LVIERDVRETAMKTGCNIIPTSTALAFAIGGLFCHAGIAGAAAQTPSILEEWTGVQPPKPPDVQPVRLDAAKTLLLVMDFNTTTCAAATRPRCVAALPGIGALMKAAREKNVLVIHTLSGTTTAADIPSPVAPIAGERLVAPRTDKLFGRMDKFFDSDLEDTIRARGIDTVLATGTSANGAVLYTVSGAAARKFRVIVPVDGMPADTAYQEQFTAYQFMTGPVIRGSITLTKVGLVSFQ